ncbi:EAL domain-containing protein [bacterium]|nr:EAL domain-containing protein [bacterium]MBU1994967.1 EAL domain-containing protein [bacterium]
MEDLHYLNELNILYVEDNPDVKIATLEIFQRLFRDVHVASDGKEGLFKYNEYFLNTNTYYDIVISDIQMPYMNGIDMSKKIKEQKSEQIIILMSAYDDTKYLLDAIETGVERFIFKPISDFGKFITTLIDVAKKFALQKELSKKAFLLEQKNKIIDEYVYMTVSNLDGVIQEASQAYLDFTGYKKEEIVGKNHSVFRDESLDPEVVQNLWEIILQDKVWKGELKNVKRNGEEYWIHTIISPLYDSNRTKIGYTSIKVDITDRRRWENLSITDSLTSVHNRRFFDHYMKRELKRSIWKRENFALLMIDVDCFKDYNDCYGHIQGDKALAAITTQMKKSIGHAVHDIFRIGGEVFAVIILNKEDASVKQIANELLHGIESLQIPHSLNKASDYLTVSIGAVNLDGSSCNVNSDDIYNIADANLYKAKNDGRNKVVSDVDTEYIKNLSNLDSITKLPNRVKLIHDITFLEEEAMLILLHVNQLGSIKDLYGLDIVSNIILKRAQELTNILIDGEASLYSLNLQEFAILVTNKALFDKYFSLLKYSILLENIDEDMYKNNSSSYMLTGFTAGIAYGINEIFNNADIVLQEAIIAKKAYKVYKKNQTARQLQETTLERLRIYKNALHTDNIIPYFQPIVDVKDGRIVKYEALARLKTDEGEIITPYYFLDSAKEDKTFQYFSRQMIQKVFNVFSRNKVNISINLTYENINSMSMLSYIKNRLDKHGGKGITFEIVESEDIKDYKVIEDFILMIKKYGCEVSIDDFGSGYSNFTHVIRLNIDYIKLDGSLIEKLNSDENIEHMIKGLLLFAKSLNIKTIAEFVSSKEIAQSVENLGIDYSQGYYFGEPRSPDCYGLN